MSQPPSSAESPLEKRSVVSSFLFSSSAGSPRVALFKRSEKVRTYKHRLAPVSGSIDKGETPIAAAWREIKEETTLTPQDLELWRQGTPYTFGDPSIGRKWIIYPFAFRFKNASKGGRGETAIQIDWEHERWEWYDPQDVVDDESFGGVPRLADSLRRVYFEMWLNERASGALQSGLEQLKSDHSSGSNELTTIGIKAFRDVLAHLEVQENWWETICVAAWHLWKNGRESMGSATLNALLGILEDIDAIRNQGHPDDWNKILGVVDYHLQSRRKITTQIIESLTAYLNSTIFTDQPPKQARKFTVLTVSSSSTVRDGIEEIFKSSPETSHLDLRILESRPLFEGVSMASALVTGLESFSRNDRSKRLSVNVYTDAAAAIAGQNIDCVLLGADRISSTGSVSNKTGSLPAVLCAKHVSPQAKIVVLSSLEKVAASDQDSESLEEENDPAEVTSGWATSGVQGWQSLDEGSNAETAWCSVRVRNTYFEWVPSDLIDIFITDQGPLGTSEIRRTATEVQKRTERYFGSPES
ncbi:Uncharacterized protein PECH_008984 [Penicillium ucsense]|uniref:Nudix hydrolase domain-containing protein n=1 Tax=Penicillium ucsense TaxID=2839758 RepID=A0A8J8WLS7_9EURO|nr:Uncharacterized protein PECM_001442 [Penicillium ucsense]KAF7733769.1 Uncharacterized protein PECH_008984 [Penicillium ucsense]